MRTKTRIFKVNTKSIDRSEIKEIAEILIKNGVIVYPTDTFYGLGVNCFSKTAVQKIYDLKKRAPFKPLSVVISDLNMLQHIVADIPAVFDPISADFWPGPLTLVFRASPNLPDKLLGFSDSIGVRLPSHPWLRELLKHIDFPLTATSANISGEKEAANPEKIIATFMGRVDLIVDAGQTHGVLPSTVVDLVSKKPKILREGAIPALKLRKYLDV
ncbi:L-threonylcarbamoyladenylate synthase [Acidobacteriota bacterium]